ncbi:hypothetical protein DdX_19852 [Ditylenchus destructor]|uniref:Uncharacterized protein n=1 Tax=Ditylenchus destructor TaxID=166010 RepID=A0AAD4MIT9_9BILA|nr:hypothetical protein DdX_19852 [Ditylenchus destructor]
MIALLLLAFIHFLLFNAAGAPDLKTGALSEDANAENELVKALTQAVTETENEIVEMKKVVPITNDAVQKLDQKPNELRALLKEQGKSDQEKLDEVREKWHNEIDPLIDQIPLSKPATDHPSAAVNELITAQQQCETQQACDKDKFKRAWTKFKNNLKPNSSEKAKEKALSQIAHLRRLVNFVLKRKDSQKGRKRVKRGGEAVCILPMAIIFIIVFIICQILKVFFCLIGEIPGLPTCDTYWVM